MFFLYPQYKCQINSLVQFTNHIKLYRPNYKTDRKISTEILLKSIINVDRRFKVTPANHNTCTFRQKQI